MGVKFLSKEWAQAVTDALNSSEDFKKAARGKSVKLQQVVTDMPQGGEVKYYFQLEDARAEVSLGELSKPEATLTQDYEVASALSKQELNPQTAFIQGKLKISGNLMKLMQLQGVFATLPAAVAGLEVHY